MGLEKQTHKLFTSRHINDNNHFREDKMYHLSQDTNPLEYYLPCARSDSIASLAKAVYSPIGSPCIDLHDGITTIERPKILPGHAVIIEPVSAEELLEFLKEFNKLQYQT